MLRDGRSVVDLWGGVRDTARGLPWERDTIVPLFSTSKGISALVLASLRSRGLLEWDATVASYWPEFAQAGKAAVTVRQLLAHEAGLAVLDPVVRIGDLHDLDSLATLLAAQRPAWEPGTRRGYHAITLGLYQNELARRVDPSGRSIGRILAEDFAEPLDLSIYIGLPESVDIARVAQLDRLSAQHMLGQLPGVPWKLARQMANRTSLTSRALGNPRMGKPGGFSRRTILAPESPSSNGVGAPRSIAALYGAAAIGAPNLPIDDATLAELAEPVRDRVRTDLLLRIRAAYALGFSRPTVDHQFGTPGMRSFGTSGLGGSFGFADPDAGVGYAWAPNRLGIRLRDDPREIAVRRAVYRCLG